MYVRNMDTGATLDLFVGTDNPDGEYQQVQRRLQASPDRLEVAGLTIGDSDIWTAWLTSDAVETDATIKLLAHWLKLFRYCLTASEQRTVRAYLRACNAAYGTAGTFYRHMRVPHKIETAADIIESGTVIVDPDTGLVFHGRKQ